MWACKSRAWTVVIALAGALIAGVAGTAEADPPRINLVWVDPTGMAPGAYGTIAAESRDALSPLGAEVRWTDAPQGAVLGPETLAVIAIPSSGHAQAADRHVMGAARTVADGAAAVWVYPDQVAWALGLDLQMKRSWGSLAEHDFARALARVASHEVLHAIGVRDHVRAGLMAARLDRQALTGPMLRVDHVTLAVARRRLAGETLSARAGR